jgi:peptidoglycan hydrolase-like protein with peptidoglycan-binding domain
MSAEYTDESQSYEELRLDSTGEWVSYAQALLATHGLGPDEVDGQYTESTEALVRQFQEASGLAADGVIGSATWAALQATPGQPPPGQAGQPPPGQAGQPPGGQPASAAVLVFDPPPVVSGIGMEWTVCNVGQTTVAAFTTLGEYEIWDRTDITRTVWPKQTFTTLNDIKPGGREPFFIDLENITLGGLGDGQYKAVVTLGTEIEELDFDVVGGKVKTP